nr:uncharacterized protein LOC108177487 [Oryctolagus cuniculus]
MNARTELAPEGWGLGDVMRPAARGRGRGLPPPVTSWGRGGLPVPPPPEGRRGGVSRPRGTGRAREPPSRSGPGAGLCPDPGRGGREALRPRAGAGKLGAVARARRASVSPPPLHTRGSEKGASSAEVRAATPEGGGRFLWAALPAGFFPPALSLHRSCRLRLCGSPSSGKRQGRIITEFVTTCPASTVFSRAEAACSPRLVLSKSHGSRKNKKLPKPWNAASGSFPSPSCLCRKFVSTLKESF